MVTRHEITAATIQCFSYVGHQSGARVLPLGFNLDATPEHIPSAWDVTLVTSMQDGFAGMWKQLRLTACCFLGRYSTLPRGDRHRGVLRLGKIRLL